MKTDLANVPDKNVNWIDRPLPRRLIPLMIAVLILCVLATHGIIRYGSISAALSRASGRRILVDALKRNIGDVTPGETVSTKYLLRNEAYTSITIQGAKEYCSCTVVSNLPCVIEPGTFQTIGMQVVAPKDEGEFGGTLSLYTDDRDTPVIALEYKGRVVKTVVSKPSRGGPD